MKKSIFFLITMTTFSAYAQVSTKGDPGGDFRKFQAGVNISPDVCFRTLKNNDGSVSSDSIMNINNLNEKSKAGFTSGLNVCYNIKKYLGFETGIQYSNKGYQTMFEELRFGMPDPNAPNQSKFMYHFHYIDIPFKANFTFGSKKIRFFSSIGITTNIFLKEKQLSVLVYSDHTDRKVNRTNYNYRKVNLTPAIGAGMEYRLNDRMSLRAESVFRYGVLKIIDAPVTGYLYSAGLNFGFYYGW